MGGFARECAGRLALVTATGLLLPGTSNADSNLLGWCRQSADRFVELAYKPPGHGVSDDGAVQGEVLRRTVDDKLSSSDMTITDLVGQRALYLRSHTSLTKDQARADVYALCASLTTKYGSGDSRVAYGADVGQSFADKEEAWANYYRPGPGCENPVDWDASVECGNARMRARAEFERRWTRGEFGKKQ